MSDSDPDIVLSAIGIVLFAAGAVFTGWLAITDKTMRNSFRALSGMVCFVFIMSAILLIIHIVPALSYNPIEIPAGLVSWLAYASAIGAVVCFCWSATFASDEPSLQKEISDTGLRKNNGLLAML